MEVKERVAQRKDSLNSETARRPPTTYAEFCLEVDMRLLLHYLCVRPTSRGNFSLTTNNSQRATINPGPSWFIRNVYFRPALRTHGAIGGKLISIYPSSESRP